MSKIDLDNSADRATSATPAAKPVRTQPRMRRRLAFTLAGAVALGTAVVGVSFLDKVNSEGNGSGGPLGSAEIVSWTAKPTQVDTSKGQGAKTLKWCLDAMEGPGGADKVSNADLRGKVTSMVVTRGSTVGLCYVAPDGVGGFWEAVGQVPALTPNAIAYDTGGSHGDGDQIFNYAAGFVGSDVKAVTMTAQGRTFEVTVENGRWTAWWPGADNNRGGSVDTATLTLADGTTRTVPRSDMQAS
ncbi:hypothetical protein ACIA8O_07605 [Kitasatospora sp. NPDC051853]|uniref:hypothetical protein n=1 Tax=Kitasatospora sp. NPDC051853 TaxID=3364058 RepID=UPI00378B1078